jgi:Zn-dependent peptidase ImmA (M78 family)/transcriptional regulator with XRE-family HTH domain
MSKASKAKLDQVFGPDSEGDSPAERAHSSKVTFVRSQVQLTLANPAAKGRQLTAAEALSSFGWKPLLQVAEEGAALLIRNPAEPSGTLKRRREELGLSIESVARALHSDPKDVQNAETPGTKSSIRFLERLAQVLALDERKIGFVSDAGRDSELGVRLREMAGQRDVTGFTQGTVLQLGEAAWVAARQQLLLSLWGKASEAYIQLPRHDSRYAFPAWSIGYELASRTRELLGLTQSEPISSVRRLVEEVLALPLIQQSMDARFAGATIANGRTRGIVVNEAGANENVWIRRMTLCHELGHLLWDPDEKLECIQVDEYSDLEQNERQAKRDPAEVRANAFAVAFLAPPDAVSEMTRQHRNPSDAVPSVMEHFGISATAARRHICNVIGAEESTFGRETHFAQPSLDWLAAENLTIDFFPFQSTPISRRGRFSWYVAKLCLGGMITEDTARMLLVLGDEDDLRAGLKQIVELRD